MITPTSSSAIDTLVKAELNTLEKGVDMKHKIMNAVKSEWSKEQIKSEKVEDDGINDNEPNSSLRQNGAEEHFSLGPIERKSSNCNEILNTESGDVKVDLFQIARSSSNLILVQSSPLINSEIKTLKNEHQGEI